MTDRSKAEKIVQEHVLWSIGAGLVPVPIVDIAAVSVIQLDMLKQLASLYRVRFSESEGKAWLSALTGSVFARLAANAVKLIPGIGSILGGISMSVMSGASTYAMGQVVVNHFEASGDFSNLDIDAARRTYDQELERGKAVASKLGKDKDKAASREVFEKLERLAELRDKGVLSDDDFDAYKKKLLDEL
jgi:uncharacterized protein (DUF697 family)